MKVRVQELESSLQTQKDTAKGLEENAENSNSAIERLQNELKKSLKSKVHFPHYLM